MTDEYAEQYDDEALDDGLIADMCAAHRAEMFALCQSPIESALLRAVIDAMPADFLVRPPEFFEGMIGMVECDFGAIVPQARIGRYKADMAILYRPERGAPLLRLVVECDGHQFHETKVAAARDRRRDRYMQAEGYGVFRFTGSEIHRDPRACAQEILNFVKKAA